MGISDTTATFTSVDNFPTQNRWRARINSGQIDDETLLFEGTSGGNVVGVVYRAVDGTLPYAHGGGAVINQIQPNVGYGNNLYTFEKMQFAYQGAWTSGGIQEVRIVPQTQTVIVNSTSGTLGKAPFGINTIDHWSGFVTSYDATKQSGSQFPKQENIWVVERNGNPLIQNKRYDGQIVGYSQSGIVSPVYAVNEYLTGRTIEYAATDSWSTSQNNYAFPNSTLLEVNVSANVNLTGIAGTGQDGQIIEVMDTGTGTLTLTNLDSNSSSSNQISTPYGYPVNVPPKSTVALKYNSSASKWYILWQYCCGGQTVYGGKTFQVANTDTWSTDQNDYVLGNHTLLEVNVTTPVNLTGIVGTGYDGQMCEIQVTGSSNLIVKSLNAGSSSANQISSYSGNDITVYPRSTIALKYNSTAQKWYILWIYYDPSAGGDIIVNGTTTEVAATVTWSSQVDNYTWPDKTLLEANVTSTIKLTGIAGNGSDGQLIEIMNVGSNVLTLTIGDGSSSSGNQFDNSSGYPIIVPPKSTISLKYNLSATKWYPLSEYHDKQTGGSEVLSGTFTITDPPGTWQSTGASFTIPYDGSYYFFGQIRGLVNVADGFGFISTKLVDDTTSTDVANTECLIVQTASTDVDYQTTAGFAGAIQNGVLAGHIITLYVKKDGSAAIFNTAELNSDTDGNTIFNFLKLSL